MRNMKERQAIYRTIMSYPNHDNYQIAELLNVDPIAKEYGKRNAEGALSPWTNARVSQFLSNYRKTMGVPNTHKRRHQKEAQDKPLFSQQREAAKKRWTKKRWTKIRAPKEAMRGQDWEALVSLIIGVEGMDTDNKKTLIRALVN